MAQAQDKLIKPDSTALIAKVLEIAPTEVKYKKMN